MNEKPDQSSTNQGDTTHDKWNLRAQYEGSECGLWFHVKIQCINGLEDWTE